MAKNSILSCILVCMLCICTVCLSTYAYLTDTVTVPQSNIASANYEIEVQGLTQTPNEKGEYEVGAGRYEITFTAQGTASTGYAFVRVGDTLLYTEQLTPLEVGFEGQKTSISFVLETETEVVIAYRWGRHGQQTPALQDGVTLTVATDGSYSIDS